MEIAEVVSYPRDVDAGRAFFAALTGRDAVVMRNGETKVFKFNFDGVEIHLHPGGDTSAGQELDQVIVLHAIDVEAVEKRLTEAGIETKRYGADKHGVQAVVASDPNGQKYLVRRAYILAEGETRGDAIRASVLLPALAKRASMLWVLLLHPSNPLDRNNHARAISRTLVGCGGRTGYCAAKLIADDYIQESLSLLRSFVEQLINAVYIRTATEDEQNRFYALTAYRVHTGMGASVAEVFPFIPDHIRKLSLAECTEMLSCNKKGKPMGWSKLGREARVAHAEKKTGRKHDILRVGLSYFDDSSEAAHGTIYGIALGSGTFKRGLSERGLVNPYLSRMHWAQEICGLIAGATVTVLPHFLDTAHDEELRVPLKEIESEFRGLLGPLVKSRSGPTTSRNEERAAERD